MKKLIILSGLLSVLGGYAANAQVSVTIGEPVYIAPPVYDPGYVEYYNRYPSQHYDRYHHQRNDDWAYWAQQRREHDAREHNDRHDDDHHDNGHHGKAKHDNGNHGKGNRGHK